MKTEKIIRLLIADDHAVVRDMIYAPAKYGAPRSFEGASG